METLLDLWAAYGSTIAFAMVNALFALSTYAVLSTGVLSFTTVVFAAVGGFLAVQSVAHLGIGLWPAFALAGIGGAVAGSVVAAAFLKLDSHWMALASLALVLITRVTVLNTPLLTGGVNGLVVRCRCRWAIW